MNYNENVNDKTVFNIETSGVSDIFPRGIKIGAFKIRDINAFKKMKEMRFKPSYNVFDIQSVLVYKWSTNTLNTEINKSVEEEFKKNKETSQTN